ncbi:MDM4 [Cordylochernes scorpioides]|uniref:MDM4 n=1 Tax=Cordylochernes scorpioides TaxID=51811 RepID=A0ABY6KR36_9ARAC|nr:MDM4 [Cordylochernes scorpioides]
MEELSKIREAARGRFAEQVNSLNAELKDPSIDRSGLYARYDRLESLHLELVALNEQCQGILLAQEAISDDEIDREFEECEIYIMERFYLEARICVMRERERDALSTGGRIGVEFKEANIKGDKASSDEYLLEMDFNKEELEQEETANEKCEDANLKNKEDSEAKDKANDSEAKPKGDGVNDSEVEPKGDGVKDSEDQPKGDGVKNSEAKPKGDGVKDSEAEPKGDGVKDSEDQPKGDGVKNSEAKPKGDGVKDSEAKPKGEAIKESEANPKDEGMKDSEDEPKGDGVKDSEAEPKGEGVKDSEAELKSEGVKDSEAKPKGEGVKESEANPKGEGVKDSEAKPKGDGVKDSGTAIKGYEPVNNSGAVAEGADQVRISDDETESIDDNEERVVGVQASRKLVEAGPTGDTESKIKDNYKETESQDLKTINKSDYAENKDDKYNKGKDHDGNEEEKLDAEQGTDSRVEEEKLDVEQGTDLKVEEKLDVEQGTDLKVEEKLDAEQGTESKVEGKIIDPKDWLSEGFIEGVNENPPEVEGHYLPRHLLFKSESKTTPIRPIPNLLRRIPEIGIKLWENKFGVLADMRRYFQVMAIRENDWDYLRFLWKKKMDAYGAISGEGQWKDVLNCWFSTATTLVRILHWALFSDLKKMLQWSSNLEKVQSHHRVQVTKRGSGKFLQSCRDQGSDGSQMEEYSSQQDHGGMVVAQPDVGHLCSICLEWPKTGIIVHGRTSHQVCCFQCASKLWKRHLPCPVCRCRIQRVTRNYVA